MTDRHNAVAFPETSHSMAIMHPLVERMMGANPTPEALEKILNLQREWEKDQAKRAYTSALVELKRDLPAFLERDKTVDFNSSKGNVHYTHTSLAGAMQTVTPILTQHGFSLTWTPGNDGKGGVTVTAKLTHRLGHSEQATLSAPPDTNGLKSAPQAVASTVTLLQRYTALSLLGLSTADQVEPTGEAEPTEGGDKVDTSKNMKAMNACVKAGKTKADVENFLGKSVHTWTARDLDKLRSWLKPEPAPMAPIVEVEKTSESRLERFDVEAKASGAANITQEQIGTLKGLMSEFKLLPDDLGGIVKKATGREVKSIADIRKSEFGIVVKLFNGVRDGSFTMIGGRIITPDDANELNAQALQQGIPF